MDFTKLKADILRKSKERAEGVKHMFNQTEVLNSSISEIIPHKAVSNGTFIWVIPYCLQFPFDPIDVTNTAFHAENTYTVPADPTDFIISLKQLMREDVELHKRYASYIGKTSDGYDISTDTITADDMEIFNNFKVPVQLSRETQKVRTAEAGQFGREFATELDKDADGNITPDCANMLQARLLNLEQEIIREKTAEYLKDKDRSNLSKDESEGLKTIRQSKAISYPRKSGIMLFLEWNCDQKNQTLKDISPSVNLKDNLRYINCNTDLLKKIMKKVGKKKDKNMSYLILKVTYGDGKGADKPEKIALAESKDFEYIEVTTYDELVEKKKAGKLDKDPGEDPRPYYKLLLDEEFDDLIMKFNTEGLDGVYEKLVKKNVYKFRPIKDEMLKSLFYTRMHEIEKYICKEIFDENIDIIEVCNEVVARRLKIERDNDTLHSSLTKIISSDEEALQLLNQANELDIEEAKGLPTTEQDSFSEEVKATVQPEEAKSSALQDLIPEDDDDELNV